MSDANKTQMLSSDPHRTLLGVPPVLEATVTIKPVQCPVCKSHNPPAVMYCVECGLIFEKALPTDAFGAPAVQLPTLVEKGGKEHPIRPGTSVVGRDADISIVDGSISRRHAQIVSSDAGMTVEELGSTNGTTLNGAPLAPGSPQPLAFGDFLVLGGVEVQVRAPGGAPADATKAFASNKTAAMAAPPAVEKPAARLVGSGSDFALKAGVNTLGRKAENDVSIPEPYVSGKHGLIEIAEDGVFFTDLGSTNGTLLNDAKLVPNMRTRVSESDVIKLGSLELKIERS